jgi:TPP-dependent pyruvate/acetoin dehydrogenase alpha subunit
MAEDRKPRNGKQKGTGRHRRPAFQMRISTKYAPRKVAEGQALSCIKDTSLTSDQLFELYRYLKLTRLVEERIVNLYRQTKVVGGVYRSLGQEATAVGSAYALREDDFITPIIRDLGSVFVKGIRPREILAQYMAKAWGPSGGKDLNVHFGYMERGFFWARACRRRTSSVWLTSAMAARAPARFTKA